MTGQSRHIFHLFQKAYRKALQTFFQRRDLEIPLSEAYESCGETIVNEFLRLGVLQDEDSGVKLDDRVEQFLEQMLDAGEALPVQWLESILETFDKWESFFNKAKSPDARARSLQKMTQSIRQLRRRLLNQQLELQRSADYDYRTESNYEVKEAKLQWRLEETESLQDFLDAVEDRMRNAKLFLTVRDMKLLHARNQLLDAVIVVGQGLIESYQRIADYLNRVRRDHARARKLIQLQDIIDRFEFEKRSNATDVADTMHGPWVESFGCHTLLSTSILDDNPTMVERALSRLGLNNTQVKAPTVILPDDQQADEPEITVDVEDLLERFVNQSDDLFVFLSKLQVEGGALDLEQSISLFCEILSTPEYLENCQLTDKPLCQYGDWRYAEVLPLKD